MQQCTMNGDTITRHDDGTIFINDQKVIKNEVKVTDPVTYIKITVIGIIIGSSLTNLVYAFLLL